MKQDFRSSLRAKCNVAKQPHQFQELDCRVAPLLAMTRKYCNLENRMTTSQIRTVSIIIPVYNEEGTIGEILHKVSEAECYGFEKEIVVIDDCSTDKTKTIIENYMKRREGASSRADMGLIRYETNDKNIGKTQTIKRGISASTGDIVIIQDGDLEYDPNDYPLLLTPFVEHDADVVYGSRFMGSSAKRILYFWHTVGNRFLTLLSNICSNLNLSDMETGYKVFRGDLIRQIAPALSSRRFGFEPEITARIAKIPEIRIYEVGIQYWGRTYKEGKKIHWFDGALAIAQIIRYNFFTAPVALHL